MTTIDIHTPMISREWMDTLQKNGGNDFYFKAATEGGDVLMENGTPNYITIPEMFDYSLRIRGMDKTGIDISIVSLTSS